LIHSNRAGELELNVSNYKLLSTPNTWFMISHPGGKQVLEVPRYDTLVQDERNLNVRHTICLFNAKQVLFHK